MWMVQVEEILDQFYRLHTPEFAYARLNWTRHNYSREAEHCFMFGVFGHVDIF
jgi:hypothetical protein